jgi:hypothetical protein
MVTEAMWAQESNKHEVERLRFAHSRKKIPWQGSLFKLRYFFYTSSPSLLISLSPCYPSFDPLLLTQ